MSNDANVQIRCQWFNNDIDKNFADNNDNGNDDDDGDDDSDNDNYNKFDDDHGDDDDDNDDDDDVWCVLRTVSWVRYRDIHLLTHGVQSYTDDKRFSAYMDLDTNTWQLRIKNVSFRWPNSRHLSWSSMSALWIFAKQTSRWLLTLRKSVQSSSRLTLCLNAHLA